MFHKKRQQVVSDADPYLTWIRTSTVSNAYDIDIPSAFIPSGQQCFIAGFHSTDFHVIDANGLSVFRFNCGGGNRAWNCSIEEEQVILEFQRKEVRSHDVLCIYFIIEINPSTTAFAPLCSLSRNPP